MATQSSFQRLSESASERGAVRFQELHPATSMVPAPPRFTFGTFGAELAESYFRHAHLWSIGVYALNGFELFGPFGLHGHGGLFFAPELNIHPPHLEELEIQLGSPDLPRQRRFVGGQAVMIAGPGHRVYGHWLSDFLPKLHLLRECGHDVRRLKYLLPADTPPFGRAWLELFGIPPENILPFDAKGERVWVETLLVPTMLHNGVRASVLLRHAADTLASLIGEEDVEPAPGASGRWIFVSRSNASQSRPLLNRQRIEEIAVSAGLEIVHPESLSLLDQVRLFRAAGAVVGEYGSGPHGSLFSRPGTVVCTLRGSLLHPGFIQSGFGNVLGHPTGYVFGETDRGSDNGRFTVSETDFSNCLDILRGTPRFESC